MSISENPFSELYVTENIHSDDYVELFSPVLIHSASELFKSGNVVVFGTQGSGKSMLLNILKSSVRLAYERAIANKYPMDEKNFVSASINLTSSSAKSFSNLIGALNLIKDDVINGIELYFADFVNYLIIYDLLENIEKLADSGESTLKTIIGLDDENKKNLDAFSSKISRDDCWHGYMNGVACYGEFKNKIEERIRAYKRLLALNATDLDDEIKRTKTIIGDPISEVVTFLKDSNVIKESTNVFVCIDQYEELIHLSIDNPRKGALVSIVNKLLGQRDRRVSYRVATRPYAWQNDLIVYGKEVQLERDRDYRVIDIDEALRRHENRSDWIFPQLASDILKRRLSLANFHVENQDDALASVFGKTSTGEEKAKIYAGDRPEKALVFDKSWPDDWKQYLIRLSAKSPLSAKLGEAWARQRGKSDIVNDFNVYEPPPWENKNKIWWRKERIEQASMQIASKRNQALLWYGKDDIERLSGGNVLVYLSICQRIWNVWSRTLLKQQKIIPRVVSIEKEYQSVGIREASRYWIGKIGEHPDGGKRKKFINYIGPFFQKTLLQDIAMSYPGANGFSIEIEELESDKFANSFLKQSVDYGDLVLVSHTTKKSDRKRRYKFYLRPIFCADYKIPHIRTKEPIYIDINQLNYWLCESGVKINCGDSAQKSPDSDVTDKEQLGLF